jgi:branched-chain amino acid aminotransferase
MIKWSATEQFAATAISLDDHGVTVGDGIFESMRVTKYGVFALPRHLARLKFSAAAIAIDVPDDQEIRYAINEVVNKLKQQNITDARLRLTLTSGAGPAGVVRGDNPNWFLAASPLNASTGDAKISTSRVVRNEYSVIAGLKTLSYLENVMALNEAKAAGFDEALILNTKSQVAEAATCNLVFEIADQLVTPNLASGALRGVTREIAIERFGVVESVIDQANLAQITGAALLSSIRGVQFVNQIDQTPIPRSSKINDLRIQYENLLESAVEYS